jgi:hypothetical protein
VFSTPNIGQVFSEMDAWLAAAEKEVEDVAKGLATEALVSLLEHSPQYSGDFAANWNMSVGTPDYTFNSDVFRDKHFPIAHDATAFHMGDTPAAIYAFRNAMGKLDSFKLGDTIWLANAAAHDEPYAWLIENNMIRFRPQNDGQTMHWAMRDMTANYTDISSAKAMFLIGGKL